MAGYIKRVTNYFGSGYNSHTGLLTDSSPVGDPVYLDTHSVDIPRDKNRNKLGEGAFARVFEGRYRGQPCAVKVFKENVLKNKDDLAYLCGLKSPNIVKTHSLWIDPYKGRNALSLVMELCDISLHEYIKSRKATRIPKSDKLKILHDVTNAMMYLHNEHIVHGDLRSPNVLLVNTRSRVESGDEQPLITAKVADFDLARHVDPKTCTYYTTTFADEDYLPPEAIDEETFKEGKHVRLTFSVDVFCFGPLAIELACMEFPKPMVKLERKKGQVVKVLYEIERREKYLKKINLSERMYTDLIVKQCMAERPEHRGSFLDLQLIIEAFQKKMTERPDHELLEEQQAKIFELRRKMEEDSIIVDKTETLKADLEAMTEAHEELLKKLQQRERDLLGVSTERDVQKATLQDSIKSLTDCHVKLGQKDDEIKIIKENWNSIIADKDKFCKVAIETKVRVQDLENQLSRLEKVNQDATRDRLNMTQQLKKAEEECKNLERYRVQCRELEARLKEEEEKLRAAEEEKTLLSTKLMQAEESLEAEISKLELEKSQWEEERKGLVNRAPAAAMLTKFIVSRRMSQTIEDLKARLKEEEEKLRAAEEEKTKLNVKLLETEKLLEARLKEEEEKLRAADEEKTSLSTRLMKVEESLEDTKARLKEEEEKLRATEEEKTLLNAKLSAAKKSLEVQLEMYKKEKKTAEEDSAASLKERQALFKSLKSHTDTVKTGREECQQLQQQVRQLKGEVIRLTKAKSDLEEDLTAIKEGEKDAKNQLEKKKKELTSARTTISKHKAEVQRLRVQLEEKKTTVTGLERSVQDYQRKIRTKDQKASENQARLKEEEEKLRAAEEEKTSLSTRLMKAEESLEDTKDQLAKNQKDLRSAQNTISQYEIDLKGVKGQLEGKGTRVKELEHCVQGYERRLKTEEQKTTDAQKEVDTLKAQLKSKEQDVNSVGRQLTEAKTRGDTAERQWRQLEDQLTTVKARITDLQKSERSLISELESVKGERDKYLQEKEKLVVKNAELEKDIEVTNKELSITKEVSTRKTREWSDLKVELEKVQESEELLKKNEEEIEHLNQELQQSKAGHSKVVSDWENEKENVSRLEEEVEHLRTELQQREESQSQHCEDKDKMRRDNYELRESLERHLHLIEQKDRTIKTLQDERKKHIQSLQAMEEKQRELTIRLNKQMRHFKQKETEWRAEIERITKTFEPALNILETEHEELQRKVVSSKEVIRQKEQEIIELKRSKDTLSVEVREKERELAKLKKKLEAEIASREENQQRMTEYKATSEKMERLAGTLQSELSELTQLFTEQEASATAKQEELKEMLEVANKERIAFTEQMEQEERIQAELQKQLDKQREQWDSEVSKADQLTERIHSLEIDLKKECVHSTELQAQLDSVTRNMRREISCLQGEVSDLERENTKLKVAKKLFDLEKANFEAYRSTSMETEESTATVLTQLKEDNKMLSERCDSYKVERDRMCEEKENLLAKLEQLKKKIETLEDQMRHLIAEKASLKDESDRWRNDSSELKIECDRIKSELLRLNQERRSLLTQQQELERERDKWMKECKAMKELSSQRMVSSSSEEPVDLEDLERQEDRKRKVVQMQTDIDRLKELAGSMAGGSDSVDPNMSSTESDN